MYHVQGSRGVAVESRHPGALLLGVLGVTLLLDQVTKIAVRASMHPSQSIPLIEDVFHLTYVRNTGAAFGLMPGKQSLFIVTTSLVLLAIALYWWRARPRGILLSVSLGLVAGGAIGNLIDRVVAGRVTDFFDVRFWPVFNIADIGVVVGAAGLFLWALFAPIEERGEGSVAQDPAGPRCGDPTGPSAPEGPDHG